MARPDVKPPGSCVVFLHNLHPWHEPLDVDLVVGVLGKEELPGQFHLGCLAAEITEELALLLNEERLREWFGLLLQDLDPLLQFLDQVMKLGGSRDAEVKAGLVTGLVNFFKDLCESTT